MKRLIMAAAFIMMLAVPVLCLVDTLMLVEINSITLTDEVNFLYAEDINNDNIKEIIACTYNHIYVYNGQNNVLLWTSPVLIVPRDLLFADINNDGYKDIVARDNPNISLFDIAHSLTIGAVPVNESNYRCYTIGDGNGDDLIDLAIVDLFTFGELTYYDTVKITIIDAPDFANSRTISIPVLDNYFSSPNQIRWTNESPLQAVLGNITAGNQLQPFLWLFTKLIFYQRTTDNFFPQIWHADYDTAGKAYFINPLNLQMIRSTDCGKLLDYYFIETDDSVYMVSISDKKHKYIDYTYFVTYDIEKIRSSFAYDSTRDTVIWGNYQNPLGFYDWRGFVIGDLASNRPGYELCYAHNDPPFTNNVYMNSLEPFSRIWTYSFTESLFVVDTFRSQVISSGRQIMCKTLGYSGNIIFINALTSRLSAIIQSSYNELNTIITDLDNNNIDEILSFYLNSIKVFHVSRRTGIDLPDKIPLSTFLQPNYPNPFNNSTAIEYGLNQNQQVTLDIFDLLGRKVETLVDDYQPAGLHRIIWHADDVPSGIYFYKLQAGDYSKTRKMMLLK